MLIQNRQFSGEIPKQSNRLRNGNIAEIARDCSLYSGELRAVKEPLASTSAVADARTIHESEGQILTVDGEYDIVDAPGNNTGLWRDVFYTGNGPPKYDGFANLWAGEISPYKIGAPAPTSNPLFIVSIEATADTDPESPLIDSFFICTYTKDNHAVEGPPCVPLEFQHRFGDKVTVTISGIDEDLRETYGIDSLNVYRSSDDDAQLEAQFTYYDPNLINAAAIYTRTYALGDTIDSLNNYPPPDDLAGIHIMSNGIGVGFVPGQRRVLLSKSYNLHAWAYEFTVSNTVVAVSSYENTVVVLTEGYPEVATIVNPEVVVPVKLTDREPCVSKRGVVQGNYGVIYPSPGGLVYIGSGGLQRITKNHLDKDDWTALQPETFVAAYRNGTYYAFHGVDALTGGTFVFDMDESNATVRRLSTWGTAITAGSGTNDLYYVNGTNIELFQGGSTKKRYLWRSSLHGNGSPYALTTRRVMSPDFDGTAYVTLRVYVREDGQDVLVHEEDVTDDMIDRINYHDRAKYWYYELEGKIDVTQIDLAGSASEMHTGS